MHSPVPKNEKQRLQVLWQHDVLDTAPEGVFDDLAELAAILCDAPVALVSLVDENRQWFKARVGLKVRETPRGISFCAHAIMQKDLFIVPDATKDARFRNSPLVKSGPRFRFYAGAPLTTSDGYTLGTLCINDTVPRELTKSQQAGLRILARQIVHHLELRRRHQPPGPVQVPLKVKQPLVHRSMRVTASSAHRRH